METLTKRQIDVLRLAANGMTNAQIGHELGIGDESVKTHLAAAFRKLDVGNRIQAINAARAAGYFNEDPPEATGVRA